MEKLNAPAQKRALFTHLLCPQPGGVQGLLGQQVAVRVSVIGAHMVATAHPHLHRLFQSGGVGDSAGGQNGARVGGGL
ncbi:hypothetical protein GCM10009642_38780 [Nocardiopsis metallicus]